MPVTGTVKLFTKSDEAWDDKQIDWVADTIHAALLLSSWTPNQNTNQYWSDINSHEVTGTTGYTANGQALTGKSVTQVSNIRRYFCDDIVWASSTIPNAARVAFFKWTGSAATSPLIGYAVLSGSESSVTANMTIDVDGTNGLFTKTHAT